MRLLVSLQVSVWSKNKVGGGGPSLDLPLDEEKKLIS